MFFYSLQDLFILFCLGLCGWGLFKTLRLPAASMLGTIAVIGTLRIMQVNIPASPVFLSPLIQVILGIFMGTRLNRGVIKELKKMAKPSLMIVIWALAIAFLLGGLFSRVSDQELFTSILSFSVGGLPEMTVLGLAMGANVAVIIVMQTFRMVFTVVAFPIILKYWVGGSSSEEKPALKQKNASLREKINLSLPSEKIWELATGFINACKNTRALAISVACVAATACIAIGGGYLFTYLGVPAGAMVGAMFFVAIASLLGVKIKSPNDRTFEFMQVGVGIMVGSNISVDTVEILSSGNIFLLVLLFTVIIFATSFGMAYLISRVTGWDFATSFLAAAPGGFTVMTILAVKYDRDSFAVSMLHLSRLLAIKTVVPFVFMFTHPL